jgi:hypothetical protein
MVQGKFAMARRHRQHARRARSPDARFPLEDSLCAFFEGSGFAAQIGENFASEME